MDAPRFDAFSRALSAPPTRRGALRVLGSLAAGALLGRLGPVDLAAKRKGKPCPPCRKKKHGKCKGQRADGTPCGTGKTCQWWLYNAAAHEQMLYSAGFQVVDRSPYFVNRSGVSHPQGGWTRKSAPARIAKRMLTRDPHQGVLHRAVVARSRL